MNPLTGDLPLHPALVHLPLGLSMVVPLLIVALLLGRRWLSPAAVGLVAGLQALLFVGALVARKAGEADEERVEEAGVSEAALEAHEEAAEVFTGLAGVSLLVLAAAAALGRRPLALPALGVAAALSTLTLLQGVQVGHAGGALVYGKGGASALAGLPAGGGEGGGEAEEAEDD